MSNIFQFKKKKQNQRLKYGTENYRLQIFNQDLNFTNLSAGLESFKQRKRVELGFVVK